MLLFELADVGLGETVAVRSVVIFSASIGVVLFTCSILNMDKTD